MVNKVNKSSNASAELSSEVRHPQESLALVKAAFKVRRPRETLESARPASKHQPAKAGMTPA